METPRRHGCASHTKGEAMWSRLFCGFPAIFFLLGLADPQPTATALKPLASRRVMLETALARDLQEHVGLAQRWEVTLTPSDAPAGADTETFPEAVVRGIDVHVPQGPVISE